MSDLKVLKIGGGRIVLNNETLFSSAENDWLKEAYQALGVDYPKFYKMDVLAQIAFLGTNYLAPPFGNYADDEVAQLFANTDSSLQTDVRFQGSYADGGSPSPSLFVYTLPNIASGEIAIRHKLYGESQFYILESFDAEFFRQKSGMLLGSGYKAVLCGWIEAGENAEDAGGIIFFAEADTLHQIDNLKPIIPRDE